MPTKRPVRYPETTKDPKIDRKPVRPPKGDPGIYQSEQRFAAPARPKPRPRPTYTRT